MPFNPRLYDVIILPDGKPAYRPKELKIRNRVPTPKNNMKLSDYPGPKVLFDSDSFKKNDCYRTREVGLHQKSL